MLFRFVLSQCVMFTVLKGRWGELDTTETLAHALFRPGKTVARDGSHLQNVLAERCVM